MIFILKDLKYYYYENINVIHATKSLGKTTGPTYSWSCSMYVVHRTLDTVMSEVVFLALISLQKIVAIGSNFEI